MIAEISLASLLTILWSLVLLMALLALAHWMSRPTDAQNAVPHILRRSRRAPENLSASRGQPPSNKKTGE